mmetsp:Transcript_47537/g.85827  ORF Transcript_47537/g.85827 Transcript_47537/m.85827 type:complete len:303 (+) Transcript_47537:171-1079(+)
MGGPIRAGMEDAAASKVVDSDLVLLSGWTTIAAVLALLAFWHLVFVFFHFGIISNACHLARLKRSDGRNPSALANHLCSVANAVVCCAVALPVYRERVTSLSSLGALFPLWSRPLAITPVSAGTRAFYLSLASYCTHACLWGYESAVGFADQLVLAQHATLALLAACMCMVDFVPEMTLAMLMLEVPSPFWALWRILVDFRARSDPCFCGTGILLVANIVKLRLLLFGACLVCTITHPDARQFDGTRYLMLFVCIVLYALYVDHFWEIYEAVHRQIAKFSSAADSGPGVSDAQASVSDERAA